MEEGLAAEHGRELLGDPPEQLLNGRAVTNEGGGHLETPGWDVADGGLDVVRNPLDKVAAVLVLHAQHLLVHFLHRHAPAEDGRHRKVASMTRVTGRHHVLGVEHLLRELRHREGPILLTAPAGERRKARHEEVQAREGYHVYSQLTEVSVKLAGEAEAGGHAAHGG